jgi:hypothetical protein
VIRLTGWASQAWLGTGNSSKAGLLACKVTLQEGRKPALADANKLFNIKALRVPLAPWHVPG